MEVMIPMAYCDRAPYAEPHALSFLQKFGHLLTWKSDKKEVIADIGCANGVVTTNVLLPYCKGKINEIIAIDISSAMIHLAKEKNKNPNVSFLEADVAKKDIDDNLVGKFNHIFSFYCLHMIADQRQCAENLFKMLKPGGEAFLTCAMRNNIVQAWFDFCKFDKWSEYLKNFPMNFSNYQISDRPQDDFVSVYKDAGFAVESYIVPQPHQFADREEFEGFLIELNFLIRWIPGSLKDDFIRDFLEMMYSRSDDYEMVMDVLVGIVKKPLN